MSQGNLFDATKSMQGDDFQKLYALYLILEIKTGTKLIIEGLDDIVLEEDGIPYELIQVKHREKYTNDQLWETIRIWSTHLKEGKISIPGTKLKFVTIASITDDSRNIAQFLCENNKRDPNKAYKMLLKSAKESKSKELKASFDAFMVLSSEQQRLLVESIFIINGVPDIYNIDDQIIERGKFTRSVNRKYTKELYKELKRWWMDIASNHMKDKSIELTCLKVDDMILELSRGFNVDLPMMGHDEPPYEIYPRSDPRVFVRQLRYIDLPDRAIRKAVSHYEDVYKWRSEWVSKDLILNTAIGEYDKRLIEEWESYCDEVENQNNVDEKALGREIYFWSWSKANFQIRNRNVADTGVITRGSYQMLANGEGENDQWILTDEIKKPRVWWHPKSIEMLKEELNSS